MTFKELLRSCRGKGFEFEKFTKAVDKMKKNGEIMEDKFGIRLVDPKKFVKCEVVRLNKTYGFVKNLETDEEIFVVGKYLKGAMPHDIVLVRTFKGEGACTEGEVMSIVEENFAKFTGELVSEFGVLKIVPDMLSKYAMTFENPMRLELHEGDKVVAQVTKRGNRHSEHVCEIVSSYGSSMKASACAMSVLEVNGLTPVFPSEVIYEAREVSDYSRIKEEIPGRLDLRDKPIFTIDGADAKDIDDAISVERTKTGYLLGVHIADVSYYVREKTALDEEALRRGTSIYYANKVVPMLPKELSNGICSLNPDEERLAFSAIITLSKDGKIVDYDFKKSVICSRVKGVYSEVNEIIAGTAGEEILKKYRDVLHVIPLMKELSDILHSNRKLRGAPDIDTAESKLILDTNDRIVDVVPRQRGEAEEMIEEFMLTANEAAATLAKKLQIPFVYRVHEYPDGEKLNVLKETMQALGLPAREIKGNVPSKVLSDILDEAKGKPFYPIVSRQVLRSMAKAKYSETPIGHYGLALENYTHFTSPIRRYPDLTIHRILSDVVTQKRSSSDIKKRYSEFVGKSANASTEAEIAAMKVERDCEDCYKAEYMENYVGESFDGMITSVTSFGFYVGLPNTVEGLVRIEDLADGQYQYDGLMELKETHTGKAFRVGDAVRVTCAGVDVNAGNIDFVPAEPESCENG